jgi:hypothetical protein
LRTYQKALGMMSPIIKFPLELAAEKNFYFGNELEDNKWVFPYMDKIPGLREMLEVEERTKKDGTKMYVANPRKLALLNTFAGRYYTTVGALTDERKDWWERILRFLSGAKTTPIDIEATTKKVEYQNVEEMQQFLIDKGLLSEFSRAYMPGGTTKKKKSSNANIPKF